MTPSDIIYKLLKDTGTSQTELARRMGYKSQGTVSNRLSRDGMTMRTFLEMLDALDYEMSVHPKVATDVRTEIVVTGE